MNKRVVIIIGDNANRLKSLSKALKSQGFEPLEVSPSLAPLKRAIAHGDIRFAVIDNQMPFKKAEKISSLLMRFQIPRIIYHNQDINAQLPLETEAAPNLIDLRANTQINVWIDQACMAGGGYA